jgi:DNA topoisomerase III
MIVCIAEKPSVARDIANVLGARNQHTGYLEGNGYQVTWTFGHLCELKYPEDYRPEWKSWNLNSLPMLPSPFGIRLKNDTGVQKQFHIIEGLMKNADSIVNCGDAGQEGELIQRWVMQKAGARCPVKRLWISSLTEESIREGFQNLEDASNRDSLYQAGLCRAIGDWVLGMNATRLYTLKYGRREMGSPPLSVGRVQTPTLALIVKRQREIENFVPEPYWVLATEYRNTLFTAQKGKYRDEQEARQALQAIENQPFTITSVTTKRGRENPPKLYDLTSLQVDCNKKFGFSADVTLSVIQSLYEKHVTTYPRVDTVFLTDDIYAKCPSILGGIAANYPELMEQFRGMTLRKSKKVFDSSKVTDHHAIIPTGVAPAGLTDSESRVFDLVARRFISVFYPDCVFDTTTVEGESAKVSFKVQGKHIVEPGWRMVYRNDKPVADDADEAAKDEERFLPDFTKGESGPHQPKLTQKMTTPPKPYTEATLLRAMETAGKTVDNEELREAMKENGIGRPSTRAAIIQTLFRRRYIRQERKSLFATATGCELIDIIHEELLKSAELTGLWEKKLRDIERRTYDAATFVREIKEMVTHIVEQVKADTTWRQVAYTPEAAKTKKRAKQ